jgi:hypothetical protein
VDLPRGDIEVNAVECHDLAEVLGDPAAAHRKGWFKVLVG